MWFQIINLQSLEEALTNVPLNYWCREEELSWEGLPRDLQYYIQDLQNINLPRPDRTNVPAATWWADQTVGPTKKDEKHFRCGLEQYFDRDQPANLPMGTWGGDSTRYLRYVTIRYVTLRTNPFELKLIWGTVLLFWHNSCIKMHFWKCVLNKAICLFYTEAHCSWSHISFWE